MNSAQFTASLVLLTTMTTVAEAATHTLSPVQTVVLPSDQDGQTRVALLFDLTTLETQPVDGAILEWNLESMTGDEEYEFSVSRVVSGWTASIAEMDATEVEPAVNPTALCIFEPQDYLNNGGGIVRFEITDLVHAWVMQDFENFGLLVATPNLSQADLAGELSSPRLTVCFGD